MPAVSRMFPGPPPAGELVPCQYVSPEGLLDGDPREREYLYLTTPDGSRQADSSGNLIPTY